MSQMQNSFSEKSEGTIPSSWEKIATEKIVETVDTIRAKTSGPAIRISRTVVYGLTMMLILIVSIPFLVIGISRGFIEIFDQWVFSSHSTSVWFVYLLSGILWFLVGILIWRRRPRGAATPKQNSVLIGDQHD